MGAVDYWCNIFTEEGIKRTFEEPAEVADVVKWWGLKFAGKTTEEFVNYMDDAGVDQVLIPSAKMASYQTRQLIWDITEARGARARRSLLRAASTGCSASTRWRG